MLFGAFFASYFFLRVVANNGPWPPDPFELPVAVAGMNTAILVSSSFTDALGARVDPARTTGAA